MKVTDVKVFTIHPGIGKNLMFVKVETDAGISGWGEAYTQSDRDTSIEAHIAQMSRYLVDRDPFHIRQFTHAAYEDFATKRGSMDFHSAVSGLEIAMWDIVGKALEQPVYNLLGGPVRPRIKLYANGWSGGATTPDEYAKAAEITVKEHGFKALKFDPFTGPWRLYPDYEELEQAAAIVGALREAVGPRIELLVEVHRRLAPMNAIRVAKMMERFRPYWFEEPCPAENIPAIKEVKDNTTIPIVTGEALYTRAGFREVLELRAADILNPDICNTGGILELVHIAAMAEPFYVGISPHGWNSTSVAAAAAVHASAVYSKLGRASVPPKRLLKASLLISLYSVRSERAMPNFLIYEYALNVEPVSRDISARYLAPQDGYIELPTEPGL